MCAFLYKLFNAHCCAYLTQDKPPSLYPFFIPLPLPFLAKCEAQQPQLLAKLKAIGILSLGILSTLSERGSCKETHGDYTRLMGMTIVVVVTAGRVAIVVIVAARVAYVVIIAVVAVALFANSFVTRLALPHLGSLPFPFPFPSPSPFRLPPLAVDSLIHHFV